MTQNLELSKKLNSQFASLQTIRKGWEGIWEDVADYVAVNYGNVETTLQGSSVTEGKKFGEKIFDGTAVYSAKLFADGLFSNVVSPSTNWFNLKMRDRTLNDMHEVRMWLAQSGRHIYDTFALSNFYDAIYEYLYIGGTFGTACVYVELNEDTSQIVFKVLHPSDCYIAEDINGMIDTVFEVEKLTAKQILEFFDKDKVPNHIKETFKTNPYQIYKIIHATYKRENYDLSDLSPSKKKIASVWFIGQDILKESGYDVFPYAVWRYNKNTRESYGRSPTILALNDIKAINKVGKSILQAVQLQVEPPVNVPSELAGHVNLSPRGINYYRDSNRLVSNLNIQGDIVGAINREERLRELIEKHYSLDFFYMLAQSDRQMTAREVVEKQGEKLSVLSAAVGRLNSEALDNIIDIVFNIEFNAGRIPELPEVIVISGQNEIKVDYESSISVAQSRAFTTQSITSGLDAAIPVLNLFPVVADNIDEDSLFLELLRAYRFPEKVLRSKTGVLQIRDERAAQAAQQAQLAQAQQSMDLAKTGSIIDRNAKTNMVKNMMAQGEIKQ